MNNLIKIAFVLLNFTLLSCGESPVSNSSKENQMEIVGTWKLLTGTLIEKGDTIVTDYTRNISFIKIINDSYFAFLQHDLNKGKDSSAVFVAGGGSYSLTDSTYIERLEYCSARDWEGNDFTFTLSLNKDTLIQRGIEKVESAGVNRINIEKYIKVNPRR